MQANFQYSHEYGTLKIISSRHIKCVFVAWLKFNKSFPSNTVLGLFRDEPKRKSNYLTEGDKIIYHMGRLMICFITAACLPTINRLISITLRTF